MLAGSSIHTSAGAAVFQAVSHLRQNCRTEPFRKVEQDFAQVLQTEAARRQPLEFLTSCLQGLISCSDEVVQPEADMSAVSLVLRQAEETSAEAAIPTSVQEQASHLFAACCAQLTTGSARDSPTPHYSPKQLARISVRLAGAYRLTAALLTPETELACLYLFLSKQRATLQQAAQLLLQFPVLIQSVDVKPLLSKLAKRTELSAAGESIAAASEDAQLQHDWIQLCIGAKNLKHAIRSSKAFGLLSDFPGIEQQFLEISFEKCMQKSRWGAAGMLAGDSEGMQAQLVQRLVAARELTLAADFSTQFGLDLDLSQLLDPASIAEIQAEEAARYVPLPLPPSAIVLVDSLPLVAHAHARLQQASVVGLDAEWKPGREPGAACEISLLQIATHTEVFLFDLLTLPLEAAGPVDRCLSSLLASPSCLKLGCGVNSDFGLLARMLPGMQAFQHVAGIEELRTVWRAHAEQAPAWLDAHPSQQSNSISLSAMAESTLGKPLNKAMQTSNWAARPLSPQQLLYAALDAHVCLQICDAVSASCAARKDDLPNLQRLTHSWP